MALSGISGSIWIAGGLCASSPGVSNAAVNADQVTKFVIVDSVAKKEFVHDRSGGWQDVAVGARRLTITLDAMVISPVGTLQVGTIVLLELYPFGQVGKDCMQTVAGQAVVDQISYTISEEDGAPVSYTATLSSKLAWTGLGDALWGGFECGCAAE